ncbi:GtrA family protein [Leucobacter massiliensis]|uniref:GtrA family protein n=1 Tax=Leucobacter massiliensis TaxID=1686285 RepID=UPI001FE5D0B4|nr:GtrA family protein [Leucobacter massiliensis]
MRRTALLRQLTAFGAVGMIGLLVDVGLFNLLRASILTPEAFAGAVLLAKALASVAAIAVNWVGNRYWSFAAQRTERPGREALGFFAVSIAAMLIPLACLFVSHVLLGLRSALADNISANVVGLLLGAAARFVLYRRWIFTGVSRPDRETAPRPAGAAGS